MIIDCHTHYLPTPMGPFLSHPLDRLDEQLRVLDAEEIGARTRRLRLRLPL
jgi:hypothetical protein